MFSTILLGLDGSDDCLAAMPVATDLARRYDAKIVLAHVDERIAAKGGVGPVRADGERVREEMHKQAEALSGQGIETTVETLQVVLGGPAHALEQLAERV